MFACSYCQSSVIPDHTPAGEPIWSCVSCNKAYHNPYAAGLQRLSRDEENQLIRAYGLSPVLMLFRLIDAVLAHRRQVIEASIARVAA